MSNMQRKQSKSRKKINGHVVRLNCDNSGKQSLIIYTVKGYH